jgi:perosamine synthetase
MMLRAQPPVHSPLSLAALWSGVAAAIGVGDADDAVRAEIRRAYEASTVLLTDSGTTALALALLSANSLKPGPVALPAFSCYDLATATDASGMSFVLYDIDPDTLGPDYGSLIRALNAGATMVVTVHLFGVPVDIVRLQQTLTRTGALLIEDAAQATGAFIGVRRAGAVGTYGVLSFGRGKGLTGGGGGALLSDDPRVGHSLNNLESRLASPKHWGIVPLSAQWLLARPSLYWIPLSLPFLGLGDTPYRGPRVPSRASAFNLGVLARTSSAAAQEASVRRAHASRLLSAVSAVPGLHGYSAPLGAEAGYLRFPLLVPDHAITVLRDAESRKLGIWPSYPRSLADLPGFGERRLNPQESFPGARQLARQLGTLPVHSQLRPRDLEALEHWIARLGEQKEP